jgi:hypothetical protein
MVTDELGVRIFNFGVNFIAFLLEITFSELRVGSGGMADFFFSLPFSICTNSSKHQQTDHRDRYSQLWTMSF